jgi:four helix bundle protein
MVEELKIHKTFRDWPVWQRAHAFVLAIYKLTEAFPDRELYGLTSQMRRAAISIAANIAEGFAKRRKTHELRFSNIAEDSVEESRYYLILAQDLGYGNTGELMELLKEVGAMVKGCSRAMAASDRISGTKPLKN